MAIIILIITLIVIKDKRERESKFDSKKLSSPSYPKLNYLRTGPQ